MTGEVGSGSPPVLGKARTTHPCQSGDLSGGLALGVFTSDASRDVICLLVTRCRTPSSWQLREKTPQIDSFPPPPSIHHRALRLHAAWDSWIDITPVGIYQSRHFVRAQLCYSINGVAGLRRKRRAARGSFGCWRCRVLLMAAPPSTPQEDAS